MSKENLASKIESNEAQLAVQLSAKVQWLKPPSSNEEEMVREMADRAIANMAYMLQEDVGRLLLTMIAIKADK